MQWVSGLSASFALRARSASAQNRCLVLPFLCLQRCSYSLWKPLESNYHMHRHTHTKPNHSWATCLSDVYKPEQQTVKCGGKCKGTYFSVTFVHTVVSGRYWIFNSDKSLVDFMRHQSFLNGTIRKEAVVNLLPSRKCGHIHGMCWTANNRKALRSWKFSPKCVFVVP